MRDGDAPNDADLTWAANGKAFDLCMEGGANAPPDAVVQVERVWQDVLLNRFGAREALADMLKSSARIRRAFRAELRQFEDRFGGELESVVDECLDFVGRRLTNRRHRMADSPFDAGLDFQTWNELKSYLFMCNPPKRGRLVLAEDFIRERSRGWTMSNIEDLPEYANDGRLPSDSRFHD